MNILTTTKKELPLKAHPTDACADLVATDITFDQKYVEYGTGLKMLPPDGYFGVIFPRSSISNYDLVLANSVGIIDEYTGEWKIRFKRTKQPLIDSLYREALENQDSLVTLNKILKKSTFSLLRFKLKLEIYLLNREAHSIANKLKDLEAFEKIYQKGDKIAQFCFLPKNTWEHVLVKELPDTTRGSGGFGSTDKKVKTPHAKKRIIKE